MKRFLVTSVLGLALAAVYGFGLIPSLEEKAACADCNGEDKSFALKVYEKFNEECKKLEPKSGSDAKAIDKACLVLDKYNKILPKLKEYAKDNRFGPGDRILFVGESQNGNLVAGANRTFSAGSPSPKNNLKVTVNKTNGGNGATVTVCAIDTSGNLTKLGTMEFPENDSTGPKSVDVSGVEGKVIRVEVASHGGALKNFKYTLTTAQ